MSRPPSRRCYAVVSGRKRPPPIERFAALAAERGLNYTIADLERLVLLHGGRTEQCITNVAALLRLARHHHPYAPVTEQQVELLLARLDDRFDHAAAALESQWWNESPRRQYDGF